jgi:tetratricopeptide (TPR) repeat protein
MTTPTTTLDASTRGFEGLKLLVTFLKAVSTGAILFLVFFRPENALPVYLWAAGLFLVAFVVDLLRIWRREREVGRGWELLEAGLPEQALHGLEVGVAQAGSPGQRARNQYGLALAWLRQGDYGRALVHGHEATQQEGKRSDGFLRHVEAPALLATLYALRGELETARAWVEAMQLPPYNRMDHALLAQAVMLCRAGKYEEAVRRIQDTPQQHVPKVDLGAVRVVHAFARERLGGHPMPLRPGCVLPVKPAREAEYAWLAREWPELATFLG